MTRAEQIREMDDKELADFLCEMSESKCDSCKYADGMKVMLEDQCAAMRYLKEEVEK